MNELYSPLVKQIFIVKQNFKLNTYFEQYYFCDKLDVSKLRLMQQQFVRFTPISLLVRFTSFELATYILGSLPINKVDNFHFQRGKLKRTRNISKDWIKEIIIFNGLQVVICSDRDANQKVASLTRSETGCYRLFLPCMKEQIVRNTRNHFGVLSF